MIERDISEFEFFVDNLLDMESYDFFFALKDKKKIKTDCFRFCSDIVKGYDLKEYAKILKQNGIWPCINFTKCTKDFKIDSFKRIIRKTMLINFVGDIISLYKSELVFSFASTKPFSENLETHKNIFSKVLDERKKLLDTYKLTIDDSNYSKC